MITLPFPVKHQVSVATLSTNQRSWLTTIIVMLRLVIISSRSASVSMSRSLVGSSRMRRLQGFRKILARSSLFFSPPESALTGDTARLGSKRKSLR